METKVCTKCGEEKPATKEFFYAKKGGKYDLRSACRICMRKQSKEWGHNNPEKAREKQRRWRQGNPEKVREYSRKYYHNNPEKAREKHRRWRQDNPEKARELARKWGQNNLEKVRELARKWGQNNLEKVREKHRKWRQDLAPSYVRQTINQQFDIPISEITLLDIEEKTEQLKYHREIQLLTKQLKES